MGCKNLKLSIAYEGSKAWPPPKITREAFESERLDLQVSNHLLFGPGPPFCKPWSLLPFTTLLSVALCWSILVSVLQIVKSESMRKKEY